MVHVETRGSCVDLGRTWVSSAKGVIIVSSHGVIVFFFCFFFFFSKRHLFCSLLMHRFLKRSLSISNHRREDLYDFPKEMRSGY